MRLSLPTFRQWGKLSRPATFLKTPQIFSEGYFWMTYFVQKCTSGQYKIRVFHQICASEVILEGEESSTCGEFLIYFGKTYTESAIIQLNGVAEIVNLKPAKQLKERFLSCQKLVL
jgi:hypothetical protein